MTTSEKLSRWAIDKVEAGYRDDIDLLINHTSLQLEKDVDNTGFSYFVPATSRANSLARTFIIDGIGYDLFPFPWEQLERMADMKHYNSTCLGDISETQILYARNGAVRQRFLALQAKQRANLANPAYMLDRAEEWYQVARGAFTDMLLSDSAEPYQIPMNAGYVCDLLAIAVAFVNGVYLKHGQTSQLRELAELKKVPEGFINAYSAIVKSKNNEDRITLCKELLLLMRVFLDEQKQPAKTFTPDFEELASWYQELVYTCRRVYHWCDEGDAVNAYLWSVMLQNEFAEWGKTHGITQLDFLSAFNADDLPAYRHRVEAVEQAFVDAITAHGVSLDKYDTIDDFLARN